MGLLGKIGGVFKAVGGAVVKMAKSVFTGKITDIATTVLGFIPGFNAAGIVGKALNVLGSSDRIRNFFQTGLRVFGGLADRFGLRFIVDCSPLPEYPPLPSVLVSLLRKFVPRGVVEFVRKIRDFVRDVWGGVPFVRDMLQHAKGLIGRTRDLVDYVDEKLPGDFTKVTEALTDAEQEVGTWVDGVNRIDRRLAAVVEMLNEVLKVLEPPPPPSASLAAPTVIR